LTPADDLDRLRSEYARRDLHEKSKRKYSPFNRSNLFAVQQRQRAVLKLLTTKGFDNLEARRILEVGCGTGGVLLEYLSFGANPELLNGTDLLLHRANDAHRRLPGGQITCSDGRYLPYKTGCFDIVLQYTALSSILDYSVKAEVAREMTRVLRKPDGLIVWYDFWLNPTNPHTRGIRAAEIRRLFPTCSVECHRVTLAPPLARALVPISWTLAALLEAMKALNTHQLVAIRP
jgi:ubiquinone/menaquinone biosynthesis C-methylase UbiE